MHEPARRCRAALRGVSVDGAYVAQPRSTSPAVDNTRARSLYPTGGPTLFGFRLRPRRTAQLQGKHWLLSRRRLRLRGRCGCRSLAWFRALGWAYQPLARLHALDRCARRSRVPSRGQCQPLAWCRALGWAYQPLARFHALDWRKPAGLSATRGGVHEHDLALGEGQLPRAVALTSARRTRTPRRAEPAYLPRRGACHRASHPAYSPPSRLKLEPEEAFGIRYSSCCEIHQDRYYVPTIRHRAPSVDKEAFGLRYTAVDKSYRVAA